MNDLDIKFSISLNHLILTDNKIVEFNLENLTNLIYLDLSKNLIEYLNKRTIIFTMLVSFLESFTIQVFLHMIW